MTNLIPGLELIKDNAVLILAVVLILCVLIVIWNFLKHKP